MKMKYVLQKYIIGCEILFLNLYFNLLMKFNLYGSMKDNIFSFKTHLPIPLLLYLIMKYSYFYF